MLGALAWLAVDCIASVASSSQASVNPWTTAVCRALHSMCLHAGLNASVLSVFFGACMCACMGQLPGFRAGTSKLLRAAAGGVSADSTVVCHRMYGKRGRLSTSLAALPGSGPQGPGTELWPVRCSGRESMAAQRLFNTYLRLLHGALFRRAHDACLQHATACILSIPLEGTD